MDLTKLSTAELAESLQALEREREIGAHETEALREAVEHLQVHRIELEMQNRALREAQEEIAGADQRYADLYDNLPIGCLTVTPAGRIVAANLTIAAWLELEKPALVGRHLRSFCAPVDGFRLTSHLDVCARQDEASSMETTLRRANGSELPVRLITRRAAGPAQTEPDLHIAVMDVSHPRQLQQVLDEIHREQQALSISISHDLRAPLITIRSFVGLVLEESAIEPEARRALERALRAGQRMDDMLVGLLEWGEVARLQNTTQRVSLDEVVRGLLAERRETIEKRGAVVDVRRPLPDVRGAPRLVTRVLRPVIANALLYTRPGEAPAVRISAEAAPHAVLLCVADRGIGIDPSQHERIFQIFERLHCYADYPGSGLGLAIARRAAERLNGRVRVESRLGEGACFHIELPHP
jgi:PAS domain S-box-containing protein